jgi:hypothetical protein
MRRQGKSRRGPTGRQNNLSHKRCHSCIYAVKAEGKTKSVRVCTNRDDAPGKLFLLEKQAACRNFRTPKKIIRTKVIQPKDEKIRFIPLTQGKFAIVDAEDYEHLSKYKWYAVYAGGKFYAYRSVKYRAVSMHRQIMGEPKGKVVDHRDGNSLNNRRSNLRICTFAQNQLNRRSTGGVSRYKGVWFKKGHNKWKAQIGFNGKKIHIGYFKDEIDAAKAYDKKAKEFFGEFAYLNFPEQA